MDFLKISSSVVTPPFQNGEFSPERVFIPHSLHCRLFPCLNSRNEVVNGLIHSHFKSILLLAFSYNSFGVINSHLLFKETNSNTSSYDVLSLHYVCFKPHNLQNGFL